MNEKFHALAELTANANWDCEHGLAIPDTAWQGAWLIYQLFKKHALPEPFVSPCGDGSIHFTFHFKDKKLNMEYKGDKAFVNNTEYSLINAVCAVIDWFK